MNVSLSISCKIIQCQVINIMRKQLQIEKNQLPSIISRPQTGTNILHVIRMKKAQLSKQLQDLQAGQISLPLIQNQIEVAEDSKEAYHNSFHRNNTEGIGQNNGTPESSRSRLKHILEKVGQVKNKVNAVLLGKSTTKKKSNKIIEKSAEVQESRVRRAKTETKPRQLSTVIETNLNKSIKKVNFPPEDESRQYDQYINKFRQYVECVPKNVKLRNQDNVASTTAQLERFNPFFNRNTRIINVCLLKIGKIMLKSQGSIIYKPNEPLDQFYIILLGKIKLVQGSFRRICKTGETVLQQMLFSEKAKKVSYERAKAVSSSYLLELKVQQYIKCKEEMIRHGLKLNWQQMEALIKRNFIIKNWMRNRKQTQVHK